MADEKVVPEVPAPDQKVETPEPVIVNKREAIENAVETENAFIPEPVVTEAEEVKTPDAPEAKTEEEILDPVERIKKATQKRIDKLTAKSKTAEERLAEAEAEIARLKTNSVIPEPKIEVTDDNTPPTFEQVEDYIAQMQSEGNFKEAAKATRYLVKLEKEAAINEMQENQKKVQTQTKAETDRVNAQMKDLAGDYVVLDEKGQPDIKSDLTLANQNGLLFKLAMDYFNDKDRHAERYNDSNVVNGFRRATADAYRDIMEHRNMTRLTPKGEETVVRRASRSAALADPDASFSDEEPTQSTNTSTLSDADIVRAEIKARRGKR